MIYYKKNVHFLVTNYVTINIILRYVMLLEVYFIKFGVSNVKRKNISESSQITQILIPPRIPLKNHSHSNIILIRYVLQLHENANEIEN